jgi:hypothetical protein
MPILTAVDLIGIQRFIFRSNRLKDVYSSSMAVEWATSKEKGLRKVGVVPEQVLMAAGGNALLLFPDYDEAKDFAARYSRMLLEETPGLDAVICHEEYQDGGLRTSVQKIHDKLELKKRARRVNAPLLGISVNAVCTETGLPAVAGGDDQLLSRSIRKIRQLGGQADSIDATQRYPSPFWPNDSQFIFPKDVDRLGRTQGHFSYIAIVHIDGNGVGRKIREWSDSLDRDIEDDRFRDSYRSWSLALDALSHSAMNKAMELIATALAWNPETHDYIITADDLQIELTERDRKFELPIRPILAGGDDLTFVCDARVALSLVECILRAFQSTSIPHLGCIYASAGVALVPSHTPFSRAYELAEGLCKSAKHISHLNGGVAALDWHIGEITPGQSLADLRSREYASGPYILTARPYLLESTSAGTTDWTALKRDFLSRNDGSFRNAIWRASRNKLKELRDVLGDGPTAVVRALMQWRIANPQLRLPSDFASGFKPTEDPGGNWTPVLDAIELTDFYMDIANPREKADEVA